MHAWQPSAPVPGSSPCATLRAERSRHGGAPCRAHGRPKSSSGTSRGQQARPCWRHPIAPGGGGAARLGFVADLVSQRGAGLRNAPRATPARLRWSADVSPTHRERTQGAHGATVAPNPPGPPSGVGGMGCPCRSPGFAQCPRTASVTRRGRLSPPQSSPTGGPRMPQPPHEAHDATWEEAYNGSASVAVWR